MVGHSTTTPSAIELLGGKPDSTINETEFDRLYIVTIGKDGAASEAAACRVLVRYFAVEYFHRLPSPEQEEKPNHKPHDAEN